MNRFKILVLGLSLISGVAMGQGNPEMLDPNIKYGVLDNGMTYYILHNEEPKDRASFYIVQNVGAILEEDDQNGLAHMLEHMAFNGSTNFPGKGVKNFLERQGVAFGSNINAYTNLDETVYNISNVPTGKSEVMDSCVLILHDWSGSLTLAGEEIDAERGVIKEEWRTRNSASRRMYNQLSDVTYYESKYAIRDVIGDMDVIDNSPYSAIRSFYEKWYRTDLQAVVIVGDFDADEMEARVKRILSKVPAAKNPAERKEYTVASNEDFLYKYATDEEAQFVEYSIMVKHEPTTRFDRDYDYLKEDMMMSLFGAVVRERLANIQQKPNAPFNRAGIGYYNMVRTMDAYYIGGRKPASIDLMGSMKALLIESERVLKYGVTETELERAKINMMRGYEEAVKNMKEVSNDGYASSLKRHYLVGEPRLGAVKNLEFAKAALPSITAAQVNELIKDFYTEDNRVVTVKGPKKVDFEYPTKEDIAKLFEEVKATEIAPFVDNVVSAPLLAQEPTAGSVASKKKLEGIEANEYTLSNGAKVVIYPTDKNENEVLFRAYSPGGLSLLKTEDLPTASISTSIADQSGIGQHSVEDLRKLLVGKQVGLSASVSQYSEGLKGSSTPDDVETLMQLIYMTFEEPRFDPEIFEAYMGRAKLALENSDKNPKKVFFDSVKVAAVAGEMDRRPLNSLETLEKLDYERIEPIYRDRISNAGDFVFVFVGAVNEDVLLPMIEKYIASISDSGRREEWVDEGLRPFGDGYKNIFTRKMEVDKQTNYIKFSGERKYSREEELVLSIAKNILTKRYFETVREQEGGSYGVGVYTGYDEIPYDSYYLIAYFDCNPDKGDRLVEIIDEEYYKLIKNGPSEEDYKSTMETLIKEREQAHENNNFWMSGIINSYAYGFNSTLPAFYEDILEDMTMKKFSKSFKKITKGADKMTIIMKPE